MRKFKCKTARTDKVTIAHVVTQEKRTCKPARSVSQAAAAALAAARASRSAVCEVAAAASAASRSPASAAQRSDADARSCRARSSSAAAASRAAHAAAWSAASCMHHRHRLIHLNTSTCQRAFASQEYALGQWQLAFHAGLISACAC